MAFVPVKRGKSVTAAVAITAASTAEVVIVLKASLLRREKFIHREPNGIEQFTRIAVGSSRTLFLRYAEINRMN